MPETPQAKKRKSTAKLDDNPYADEETVSQVKKEEIPKFTEFSESAKQKAERPKKTTTRTTSSRAKTVASEEESEEYTFPPLELLSQTKNADNSLVEAELKSNSDLLVNVLKSFGVEVRVTGFSRGPSVTRYEIQPAVGVKISKITGLADDIALQLRASNVRISPIPNKASIGIEVPNTNSSVVGMRDLIDTPEFKKSKAKLLVSLGKDVTGSTAYCDLAKMPHLLVAGTTGSGKSVCLNAMIMSILYRANPNEVKFVMIDPKAVEFPVYNGIPHLLVPVVTDPR
ncbi:MAG: DNA translocase FtsK, partial [Clostridia bacterium]|nr:DNA translocase FtsK [Clostridia bacterium]